MRARGERRRYSNRTLRLSVGFIRHLKRVSGNASGDPDAKS